ncbi:S-layer homology domain-containing protein [Paenibacillus ferrarius]|uniref:S-layer homology domain-containing protein n=1 Tax=Paenibacillus ferrarius TaxID=1469647 RepID=UPI003D28B960
MGNKTLHQPLLKIMLVISIAWMSFMAFPALALGEVYYKASDEPSSVEAPDARAYVSGKHMVWMEDDERGISQVFYRSLETGETRQITTSDSSKTYPVVSSTSHGVIHAAWLDRRTNGVGTGGWAVWGMDISEGTETQLSSQPGSISRLSLDGDDLVWYESADYKMYHYSFITKNETQLGNGRTPLIAQGNVLYMNLSNGGLSLYKLETAQTYSVLSVPSNQFIMNAAFNGTKAIIKQSDAEFRTKMVVLDVSDPGKPVSRDLTPQTKKNNEYSQIFIGNQSAAWVQDQGGYPQLNGVNLVRNETFAIEQGDSAINAYAFVQDQLVMKNGSGKIAYRTMTRIETFPSAGSGGVPVVSKSNVSKMIGTDGGVIEALDGAVTLSIAKGVMTSSANVNLKLEQETDNWPLTNKGNGHRQFVSGIWSITGIEGNHPGNVQLSFSYDPIALTLLEQRKLLVYRFDDISHTWIRVNGQIVNGKLTANIPGSGVYALLINDVSFRDTGGHWAQNVIEPLAARDIVNGMTERDYAPDALLTRAQFVKLLTASMGELPSGKKSAFSDVQANHWAAGWIGKAAELGLIEGSEGYFNPDEALTREQMIVMLARAMGFEQTGRLSETEVKKELTYADAEAISSWARVAAAFMSQNGLIEGSEGQLKPRQTSTRAEAAAVIYRFLNQQQRL